MRTSLSYASRMTFSGLGILSVLISRKYRYFVFCRGKRVCGQRSSFPSNLIETLPSSPKPRSNDETRNSSSGHVSVTSFSGADVQSLSPSLPSNHNPPYFPHVLEPIKCFVSFKDGFANGKSRTTHLPGIIISCFHIQTMLIPCYLKKRMSTNWQSSSL